MAWRAGCRIANLELIQFHPTCLFHPQEKNILLTEALRGEGAILLGLSGERIMKGVHELGDLAPRDIVARSLDAYLKKTGFAHALLDLSALGQEKLREHFPNLISNCQALGYDPLTQPIPIVPAAHYSCGGVLVDGLGRTDLEDLFALGEVACTGLHGANRLASNSLLEGLVFSKIIADYVEASSLGREKVKIPPWRGARSIPEEAVVVMTHSWDEIRRLMWNYVGIVRSDLRLKRAKVRMASLLSELSEFYWDYQISKRILEVRNLAQVADLIIRSAMMRKESRGVHFTVDYPEKLSIARDTILN